MIKNILSIFLILLFTPFIANSQTYEIIEVNITCESKPVTGNLNSDYNDFSPAVLNKIIYFSSDRNPDKLQAGENNWNKNRSINLYQAEITGDIQADSKIKNIRLASEYFFNGNHTGPASFSTTGDTIFLSQVVVTGESQEFHPQIYFAVKTKNKFGNLYALPFNKPEYSYGHPHYDSKTKRLYFASNKPGGKGGKDIYYSDLTVNGWSDPKGLDEVNTVNDELFPFLSGSIFFYASNPEGKNKGLDIFWRILGSNKQNTAVKGLNVERKDDFGIYVFPGMTKGYFSSNRDGNDDVFYFSMDKTTTIKNEMAGEFTFKHLTGIPADLVVQILDEDNFVLYETKTDETGSFVFKNIAYDKNYSIKAISENALELSLKNQEGSKRVYLLDDEENKFLYRKIGTDKSSTLLLIPEDMIDFSLNQGHLSGQLVYEDKPNEYPYKMPITLINKETGQEEFITRTDKKGNFDFEELAMSKGYILKLPQSKDNVILLIYDLKGNVVAQMKTNSDGEFVYRKINPDYSNRLELEDELESSFEYDRQTIWGYFAYDDNKALDKENLKVSAYTEDGKLIESKLTNSEGVFRFRNLPPNENLLFKLEENGENFILDDFTLYIFDRNGQKVAGLKRGQEGYFTFRPLGYDTDHKLSKIEEENIKFILGANSNRPRLLVYFDSDKSQVKNNDLSIIDNIYTVLKENSTTKIEINAYADAKSSDAYNLILSQKRGDWIANYLINKGISADRIIVNAYGESRLADKTNDALNRRAEIHLY